MAVASRPRVSRTSRATTAARTALSVHVGLNAVDPKHYEGWSGELLACEFDAKDMTALAKSSGDRYCDESAERAVRKSIPLPPSPRGAISVELVLNPKAAM